MILDKISNYNKYLQLNIYFKKAFNFILNADFNELQNGRFDIDSDNLFAIVSRVGTTKLTEAKMESHQRYIDIHFIISGSETMGWKALQNCQGKIGDFNFEEDYVLYQEECFMSFVLPSQTFVIHFPEDVHLPCLSTKELFKIVLKVKL